MYLCVEKCSKHPGIVIQKIEIDTIRGRGRRGFLNGKVSPGTYSVTGCILLLNLHGEYLGIQSHILCACYILLLGFSMGHPCPAV